MTPKPWTAPLFFRRMAAGAALLSGLAVAAAPAEARFAIPGFELVHTVPVETMLATPDLRDPVTVWCEMIDGARRTIDLEQFYVAAQAGEPLDEVLASLEAAGRRGVRIRFLMEKKGLAASTPETIERLRRIPGLEFRLLAYADLSGDGIIHAKFFVVDGTSAYAGSQNFDWRALKHIDETGLRITEPTIVGQLSAIFRIDWEAQAAIAAGGPAPTPAPQTPAGAPPAAYLVASPARFDPPGVRDSERELVRLLGVARHEIRIEVMDYAPLDQHRLYYGVIDQAVRAAASRGVAIKLLVADWNLTAAKRPYLESLAVLPNVEVRVATIPPARAGVIPFARVVHTKTMAIDGAIAWIGTSNWEGGYLDTSRNVEIVLANEAMAKRVAALHQQLWDSPYARPLARMPAPVPR